eukprot:CAMPEP_0116874014 /NCGR_PEP_ID=MMETSP0463-20121206/5390_1 /TAXON_ID=181622 /ORGANISM="Strombidinopsis sp, Strain SopsisLIS2011" /LENGTH=203 /DNA_ID=CAMNT_0004517063 /DNA_START=123 /DNA_END=734 /DNA_ORIENTATION=+
MDFERNSSMSSSVDFRSRSIQFLLDQRNNEFDELEDLNEPIIQEYATEYKALATKMSQLKINNKISVYFNPNDPIFELETELPIEERDEESFALNAAVIRNVNVNTANSVAHLIVVHASTSKELTPVNNPDRIRKGLCCLVCNKKYLYRDAMNEYAIKLEIKENETRFFQDDLLNDEARYEQAMRQLSKTKDANKNTKINNVN